MKYIFIFFIKVYQLIPGPWHNSCRHIPTCSNYSIEAFEKHGAWKGLILCIKRILNCTPWGTMGIDLVPNKEKS